MLGQPTIARECRTHRDKNGFAILGLIDAARRSVYYHYGVLTVEFRTVLFPSSFEQEIF